jgi:hypothetical protein
MVVQWVSGVTVWNARTHRHELGRAQVCDGVPIPSDKEMRSTQLFLGLLLHLAFAYLIRGAARFVGFVFDRVASTDAVANCVSFLEHTANSHPPPTIYAAFVRDLASMS